MKTNALGRTGLAVSEICLGTMTWGVQNDEAEAFAQIEYALDRGVNFFDTAELYAIPANGSTYGKTETIIGNWFARSGRRKDVILASKIAGGHNNPWIRDGRRPDRASVRQAVEDSLRRLRTDHIDLYQIHWAARGHYHFEGGWTYAPHTIDRADALDNLTEVVEAMGEMVAEGKIGHLGVSNETAWGISHMLKLAETRGLPRLASVQNEYSLLRREFDHDLAEIAHFEDVGLLAYSPLAAGVLTGKYLDGNMPAGSRGAIAGGIWRANRYSEPAVREYLAIARAAGLDPAQMALGFCLSRPFITSVIIGATTMEQLKTNIDAASVTLSEDVLAAIEDVHRRYPRPL
ncbi:aldo/keto reductase [Arsenicitalea aurantiaca]|uniref:Aldo/keto reductase n=1 Tax=Arsenicitalea aurantiaca TaxID=1783274 RepID=A0A433XJW5_9HYPH|nr:aldo/keto reductase [Arsenicitalea aurantiaca]RUT34396.1 aldo/keto reductase [Arsenicitalea aurantiaca]